MFVKNRALKRRYKGTVGFISGEIVRSVISSREKWGSV